jgi:hypothetical protein
MGIVETRSPGAWLKQNEVLTVKGSRFLVRGPTFAAPTGVFGRIETFVTNAFDLLQ